MAMLRCTTLHASAVTTPRYHQSNPWDLVASSSPEQMAHYSSRAFLGISAQKEQVSRCDKDVSRLSSLSTDCDSFSRSGDSMGDISSDSGSVGDGMMVVCSAAGVTLGSPRHQNFLVRAEQSKTRQFTISKSVNLKQAGSESRKKTRSHASFAEGFRKEGLIDQAQVGKSGLAPERLHDSYRVANATTHTVESEGVNLKMEQCLEARSRHISWLRRALQQQISDYENEWAVMEKQQIKEQTEQYVLEQQRAGAERRVQERVHMRQQRERLVQEKIVLIDAHRQAKLDEMQQREIAREQRLAKEAWWQQQVAKERAASTAARHEEVRKEGVRLAQEVQLSRAAKMEFKQNRTDAVLCETRRINDLRKGTNVVVEDCLASMKHEILQQRLRSVFDIQALHEHMDSLMHSLPFSC